VESASRSAGPVVADFERDLAAMREPFDIPGMSAAIAERGEIVWTRGFGISHRERNFAATATRSITLHP
jgi:CubicO group peptidase (beta-lactamase class C family)